MAKKDHTAPGKAPLGKAPSGAEVRPAPLGYTAEGKPRQRAVRRYFGLSDAGQVLEYHSYEAREIDVKEGRVKRITRDEASRIEALGRAYQSPLIVSTQWSPGGPGSQAPAQPAMDKAPEADSRAHSYARRELIEARALLSTMEQTMEAIKARLKQLEQEDGE